jgi:hypothetical protein
MKASTRFLVPACAAALALSGCASLPGIGRDTTPNRPIAPPHAVPDEFSFSVSGEYQPNHEQCFMRFEVGYPPEIVPQRQVNFDLEFEMRSEGDWIVISLWEGFESRVPGDSPVGKPFRGEPHRAEVMDYLVMDTMNLKCEDLRARIVVKACEPGPCPGLVIDDRGNLFPLELVDQSPR